LTIVINKPHASATLENQILYQHEYDDIIVRGIWRNKGKRLNFSQIHRLLCESNPGVSVSETTVSKHLKILEKEEILKHKKESYNRYNQTYYYLTDAAKLELRWSDSFRPVRARTKPTGELKNIAKDYEIKAFILTLLRAASGTELPMVVNESVVNESVQEATAKDSLLGAVAIYNQTTRKYEYLKGEKVEEVTHQDMVAHNDMMSLFRDVDFTKSKDYVEILQTEFGLQDAIEVITRRGNNGDGIKITHRWLKEFLVQCECMLSWVGLRIRQTLIIRFMDVLYKDGIVDLSSIPLSLPRIGTFEREAFKWYIDIEGRKAFNSLYDGCIKLFVEKMSDMESSNELDSSSSSTSTSTSRNKRKQREIRKFIREDRAKRESGIKQWDKTIIAYYHGLYKCDRIIPNPPGEWGHHVYKEYRDYVRKFMSEKYRRFMDYLSEMLYPEFLQKRHGNDSELKQFVESLPDADSDR
jgi:DNA-binding Lrp family transcriptional regulator